MAASYAPGGATRHRSILAVNGIRTDPLVPKPGPRRPRLVLSAVVLSDPCWSRSSSVPRFVSSVPRWPRSLLATLFIGLLACGVADLLFLRRAPRRHAV
jgi:hypothetical protein